VERAYFTFCHALISYIEAKYVDLLKQGINTLRNFVDIKHTFYYFAFYPVVKRLKVKAE